MSNVPSSSERLVSAYKRLVAVAETQKIAARQFSAPIAEIDRALQRLDLGLITWQKIAGGEDDYGGYWSRDVGYARIKGDWGLAIRSVRGHHGWEEDEVEQWLFGEAPSSMRIEALEKVPDLLEELIKNAEKTTKKLQEKTVEARELATALKVAVEELKPPKKER